MSRDTEDQLDDLAMRRAKRERYQQILDRTYEVQLDVERLRARLVDVGMVAASAELREVTDRFQWLVRALNERLEIS